MDAARYRDLSRCAEGLVRPSGGASLLQYAPDSALPFPHGADVEDAARRAMNASLMHPFQQGDTYSNRYPDTLTTRHNLAHWREMAGDPACAATASEELLPDYS